MRPIDLDFRRSRPRSAWAGWTLLALGVALAADVTVSYHRARDTLADREARWAKLGGAKGATRPAGAAPARAVAPEEVKFARETIRRISTPWRNLFGALESTSTGDISLLSIEPDPESGTVVISGESKDYLAVLNYVSRLEGAKTLRGVDLIRHEVRQNEPQRPVAFSVSAVWKESR
jgi:hypothetical protein